MRILAFDVSLNNIGWVLVNNNELMAHGRGKRVADESSGGFTKRIANNVARALIEEADCYLWHGSPDVVIYEVQYGPIPAMRRKAIMMCYIAIGRMMQELGYEGEPMQADNKGKKRGVVAKKYTEESLNEHEKDALALADRYIRKAEKKK